MYLTSTVGRGGIKYLTPREGIKISSPRAEGARGRNFSTFPRGEVFYTSPPDCLGKAFLHSHHTFSSYSTSRLSTYFHTPPIGRVFSYSTYRWSMKILNLLVEYEIMYGDCARMPYLNSRAGRYKTPHPVGRHFIPPLPTVQVRYILNFYVKWQFLTFLLPDSVLSL